MSIRIDDEEQDRFFTSKGNNEKNESDHSNIGLTKSEDDVDSEDIGSQKCLTLRVLQKILPCVEKKSVWEPSQGDVFKTQEVEEIKYPGILRILEHPLADVLFVISALMSIFMLIFSHAFIIESRFLWAIIHTVNSVYTLCVFSYWLQILIKSKYAKTNQGYSSHDVIFSLLSVIPIDIIALVIYALNENPNDDSNPVTNWITISRLNYLFRLRGVFICFTKWDNQLAVGDFKMFIMRTSVYTLFIVHLYGSIWHWIACDVFQMFHFKMKSIEATTELCHENSWVKTALDYTETPLFLHVHWNVLLEHYLISIYWATVTCFRLGATDIDATLISDPEVAFAAITQISAWIFVIIYVSGSLTSLLVEMDTERELFLTRRFTIERFLDFSKVAKKLRSDVNRYYDYLWARSRGIHKWDMVEQMPITMKSEIYYDVYKFVLDQLPLFVNLEEAFLMNLALHMKHNFYLTGQIIRRKNETAIACFYVMNGHLEVLSEDESHPIAEIRSGSVIGEIYLIQPYPRVATIRCGTECDILVLSKEHFKIVLEQYPEIFPVLLERLEKRLEQCGLLIALCEKQNEYPKAFQRLKNMKSEQKTKEDNYHKGTYEMVTSVLDSGVPGRSRKDIKRSDDFDGLSIGPEIKKKLTEANMDEDKNKVMDHKEATAAAYLALEADVNRAASLAKDLNIPRSPLTVAAPSIYRLANQSSKTETTTMTLLLIPAISKHWEERTGIFLLWKTLVLMSSIIVIWYYPYQFAYGVRPDSQTYFDYTSHLCDLFFLVDFILDMLRIVITPRKTLESPMEILAYRIKTCYFYVRLFSFLPIEYVFGPVLGLHGGHGGNRYYYLFKFNRLFQYYECIKYLKGFEGNTKFPPHFLFLFKSAIRIFFVAHSFGVIFEVVLAESQDNKPSDALPELGDPSTRHYDFVLYWAIQVITSTGNDDIPLRSDAEIFATVLGLIIGVSMILFLSARVAAILVNAERRRVSFKQAFYSLMNFMDERKFPKLLTQRVTSFYHLQWKSHEGVPHQKSPIWDAPKPLIATVAAAQAYNYVSRIPLFKYCPDVVITDVCTVLRQYIVPPNEVILYASDRERDLYIIVKGFCQISYKELDIGNLSKGQYFGLPGLIYGTNKPVQIKTITHCQFFCLKFEDFVVIAKNYPDFLQEFKILRGDAPLPKSKYGTSDLNDEEIPYPDQGPTLPHFEQLTDTTPGDTTNDKPTPDVVIEPDTPISVSAPTQDTSLSSLDKSQTTPKLRRLLVPKAIVPTGRFLQFWVVFRIISSILVTNFAPVQVAFPVDTTTSLYVMLAFDIIAWIDMLLCLFIGYHGAENQLVTDFSKTSVHYLKGPFLLDLLACFPFEYIVIFFDPAVHPFANPPEYNGLYSLVTSLRLNRMIQCYRLVLGGQILQKTIFRSLSFLTLLQVVPMMFTFLNITTCISVLAVCETSKNGEPMNCVKGAWITEGKIFRGHKQGLTLDNAWISYIRATYWVFVSALGVGFGDFNVAKHPTNRRIAIAVIYIGTIVSGYLVSKLTACLIGEDSRRIEIREKTKIMFRFLEQFNVPRDLRRRVKEFYFCSWDKTQHIFAKDLFSVLTPTLRSDAMKKVYEEKIRRSPLFCNLDLPGIRIIATRVNEVHYPEGEFVIKFGDLNSDVFYVAKGILVAYTEHGDIITYIGHGSLVGEISALFEVQRLYSMVAATDVEIYRFKKEDFLDFLSLYPDVKEKIEQACLLHYKETIEATAKSAGLKEILPHKDYVGADEEIEAEELPSTLVEDRNTESSGDEPEVVIHGNGVRLSKIKSDLNVTSDAEFVKDPLRLPVNLPALSDAELAERDADRRHWISFFLTYGRIPRDEMGIVHICQEKHKIKFTNFVIHPAAPICSWVSVYLFLTALSCGLSAYEIAFSTNSEGETYNLMAIRCSLEVFFIIRIIGNFHLGYYDDFGIIDLDIRNIIKRYVCHWNGLFIDLVTTLPFYLLSYIMGDLNDGTVNIGTLSADIRGLQLLRVLLFARYLQETEADLRMKAARVKIVKVSILLCFVFHFCACAWYLVACNGMSCLNNSWMSVVLKNLKDQNKIQVDADVSIGSRYLLSLYYVSTATTFTGLSDITPRTTTELCATIALLFTTIFLIGFLVGEMTQCLASQVASKIHYRHKLKVMESHFVTLGLSALKVSQVRQYFRLLWLKCNGMVYDDLLAELPYPLRTDIAMKVYGPNLRNSRLLGKLDDTVIRQLCSRMRHEIFMPGSHIVRSGDVCSGIYFVKKGEVVILDETSNLELCVEILYENECFGEVKVFLKKEQFRFSYIARMETEVGVLFAEDLEDVLGHHHGLYEELFQKASKVRNHRLAMKEEENKIPIRTLSNNLKPSLPQHLP